MPPLPYMSMEKVDTLETSLASVPVPSDIPDYVMVPMKID